MSAPDERPLPPEIVEAAAAAWLSLRDRGLSPAETAAFLRWMQADPRHAELFNELDRTWRSFDRLATVPAASAPATASAAMADADLLAPRPRPPRRLAPAWAALGAAAALALGFVAFNALRTPRHAAETEVGAFRKLDLPDGSVAQLNTDSALDVAFTPGERRVRVVRGEIFFTVAKDAARPFLVTAGPVVVRAVGTAFNVRHRADAVEVLVTEGRIALTRDGDGKGKMEDGKAAAHPVSHFPAPSSQLPTWPTAELSAGDRAVIPLPAATRAAPTPSAAPVIERIAAPAVQRALAWQERRLEFDAAPLAEVVREFNRHNRRQLVIADPALAARRFSGAFRADGLESFVRLLEVDFGVCAERRDREIVLRSGR
jgi:transmembrane sensor